ncbi:secondary thiamine-phosphate synthase enzyme YjbQ [Chloroflexota bacterium]
MIATETVNLETNGNCDVVDITRDISQAISNSSVKSGTVTIFVKGSTAGITMIEYEPGVVNDFKDMFQRIIPRDIRYEHDRAWGDGNGHSHVRASLLGFSLVLPFNDGSLVTGTWQQIVLVDFDNRPRTRQIILQIMGE